MDANFAGSQRVAGRRRRRLASESDEAAEAAPLPSPAPEPLFVIRSVVHAGADEAGPSPIVLPLSRLIPVSWWGYVLGGFVSLLPAAGLLVLTRLEAECLAIGGPRLIGLTSLPDSTAAAWYSGLLMGVSAQLALLIWWGRSGSLKDFDGRYRIWRRLAVVWLGLGLCAATGAHRIVSDLLLRVVPIPLPRSDVLSWLVAAAIAGVLLLIRLTREMAGCRTSRNLLLAAGAAYAVAGVLEFSIGAGWSAHEQDSWRAVAAILGHWLAFMSMWVHARHVLHCSIDPSMASRRRSWIRKPHFTAGSKPEPSATGAVDPEPKEPRERKARKRRAAEDRADTTEVPEEATAEPLPQVSPAAIEELRGESERAVAPVPAAASIPASAPASRSVPTCDSAPPNDESDSTAADDAEDSGWNEPFPKPDMRGMSKKQRRRLMQELREKERAGRRS